MPQAAFWRKVPLHDRFQLFGKRRGAIYNGGGKPFEQGWIGLVQQFERLIQVPAIDIERIIDRQLDHIAGTIEL